MKRRWLDALDRARGLVNRLPDQEIGCLYLDEAGTPTTPAPSSDRFQTLVRHHGSVGGAWPTVSALLADVAGTFDQFMTGDELERSRGSD